MKSVALIEGFSGGPIHTRPFRRALRDAGFKVIRNRRQADIIIAHSAGIYAVPADTQASLLMLIGPTYWPGRPLIKRVTANAASSRRNIIKHHGWRWLIWTQVNQIFYFFTRNWYMWLGIINNNKLDFIDNLKASGRKIIIVRNTRDNFCSPDIKRVAAAHDLQFAEVPGVHDDFVKKPEPYIRLIKQAL